MGKFIDLTGRQFGRLTVIGKAGYKKNKTIVWICQCSCGNVIERPGIYLTCGDTKSCGCYNSEATSKRCRKDLTGQKFGKLTVLGYDQTKRKKQAYWWCQCECGRVVSIFAGSLSTGKTTACGCVNMAIHRQRMIDMHYKHGLSRTKEYIRFINRRRKEWKRELDIEWTDEMEFEIYNFFPVCVVCGGDYRLGVDHVKPLSKGFGLSPSNAVVLCQHCNSTKQNKMPDELPDRLRIPILKASKKFSRHWNKLVKSNAVQLALLSVEYQKESL